MNYSEMSDFEINKAVAIALGHKCYYDNGSFTNGLMGSSVVVKGNGTIGSVNFVSSWADAGPIIEANKISIFSDSDEGSDTDKSPNDYWWSAISFDTGCQHNAESNPLRAAMIVFLMMKEAE